MRGQNAGPAGRGPPLAERRHRPEGLGVEHDRGRRRFVGHGQQIADELDGGESRSEPRPEYDRVVFVIEDPGDRGLGIDFLEIVLGQGHRRRLDDFRGEQRLERLRDRERDEPSAGAAAGAADEERGPRVIERSGDDEELAERALVTPRRPARQERGGGLVVERRGCGRCLGCRGGPGSIATAEAERS